METNIFDKEEVYDNCTVQVLSNSITGETSVGWWRNDKPPEDKAVEWITEGFNEVGEDKVICSKCRQEAVGVYHEEPMYDENLDGEWFQCGTEGCIDYILTPYCPNCGSRIFIGDIDGKD